MQIFTPNTLTPDITIYMSCWSKNNSQTALKILPHAFAFCLSNTPLASSILRYKGPNRHTSKTNTMSLPGSSSHIVGLSFS